MEVVSSCRLRRTKVSTNDTFVQNAQNGFQITFPQSWGLWCAQNILTHRINLETSFVSLRRYLFNDTWNFFDTSTIVCSLVAFVFRIIALHKTYEHERGDSVPIEDQSAFFVAKVVLAASTPLLFARVLSLSQIDGTLGPMTQIIWTMLSHLVHFSFFLLVLITSFALTFYGLYSSCVNGNESYGTLADATLSMFKAMLGDFEFDDLRPSTDCNHPDFAEDAATALLVVYLVLVTVLFLNLLIAILSTAHAEVRNSQGTTNRIGGAG